MDRRLRAVGLALLAAGAQRIRFAMMPHACYSIRNREAGVTCALAAHGRRLGDAFAGDPTDVASVQTFLRRQRPDALVCCCDTFAAHLMNALGALGKRVPDDLLLAGFDPLMLGYEKKQSVFLPPEYLRGIFSLSGIVMPPVLLHGVVAGRWKRSGKRLLVTQFRPFSQEERGFVETAAAQLWGEAVQPVFQDA